MKPECTCLRKDLLAFRNLDPRVKMLVALALVMLTFLKPPALYLLVSCYFVFIVLNGLLFDLLQFLRKKAWIFLVIFALDVLIVNLAHGVAVLMRILLLASSFLIVTRSTEANELVAALNSLGLPYRMAFAIGIAFGSIGLYEEQWRAIKEAQLARSSEPKALKDKLFRWISLLIPSIVLTTHRAWGLTEAAHARGLDSPERVSYTKKPMKARDWLWAFASIVFSFVLLYLNYVAA
ncbi:MAG: energy-coupling factor transporter transmembrane component T [Anaerolineaceae bacterium]|nr:energy-coupling factor transporter transmembrane component T [Anaerolineaceae bacterium]